MFYFRADGRSCAEKSGIRFEDAPVHIEMGVPIERFFGRLLQLGGATIF